MSRIGRVLAEARVAVLAAAVLGVPVSPAQEHGAVHSAPAPVSSRPAALYTADDLQFLSHMIVHHQQALDMAALVPARSGREEFQRFARYIAGAQAAEIRAMQGLLEIARERGFEVPHFHAHGDPPMHGMLSSAQMAALAAARGAEFERLWLEGMIHHHQGALDMAHAQQVRQFESGRRPYGLDVLVEEIIVVQRAEIAQMREWLEKWGRAN